MIDNKTLAETVSILGVLNRAFPCPFFDALTLVRDEYSKRGYDRDESERLTNALIQTFLESRREVDLGPAVPNSKIGVN